MVPGAGGFSAHLHGAADPSDPHAAGQPAPGGANQASACTLAARDSFTPGYHADGLGVYNPGACATLTQIHSAPVQVAATAAPAAAQAPAELAFSAQGACFNSEEAREGPAAPVQAEGPVRPTDPVAMEAEQEDMVFIRGGKWSSEEHQAFLEGYARFGRSWRDITTVVPTRTAEQIRTHAQKYFKAERQRRAKSDDDDVLDLGAMESELPPAGAPLPLQPPSMARPPLLPLAPAALPASGLAPASAALHQHAPSHTGFASGGLAQGPYCPPLSCSMPAASGSFLGAGAPVPLVRAASAGMAMEPSYAHYMRELDTLQLAGPADRCRSVSEGTTVSVCSSGGSLALSILIKELEMSQPPDDSIMEETDEEGGEDETRRSHDESDLSESSDDEDDEDANLVVVSRRPGILQRFNSRAGVSESSGDDSDDDADSMEVVGAPRRASSGSQQRRGAEEHLGGLGDLPPFVPGQRSSLKGGIREGRWSREEHALFLRAFRYYGKAWKEISHTVCTRTPEQIRTHAQKWFAKQSRLRTLTRGRGGPLDDDLCRTSRRGRHGRGRRAPPSRPTVRVGSPLSAATSVASLDTNDSSISGYSFCSTASSSSSSSLKLKPSPPHRAGRATPGSAPSSSTSTSFIFPATSKSPPASGGASPEHLLCTLSQSTPPLSPSGTSRSHTTGESEEDVDAEPLALADGKAEQRPREAEEEPTASAKLEGARGKPLNEGRWTKEEHSLFLEGLRRFGKSWKDIQTMVKTRTPDQIRTHAQKWYIKVGVCACVSSCARSRAPSGVRPTPCVLSAVSDMPPPPPLCVCVQMEKYGTSGAAAAEEPLVLAEGRRGVVKAASIM